jgi:hypothetical protein
MSSLTNFLQQYSNDISARQEHQNDTDDAVRERKANTLEEKFQHAKDAIESGGAELGGAGAAFHLGRKIYRQVQARKAAKVKQTSEANSNATDQQTRGADGQGEAPAAEAPAAEAPAAEAPAAEAPAAEAPAAEAPAEAPASDLETRADDVQARFRSLRQRVAPTAEDAPSELDARANDVQSKFRQLRDRVANRQSGADDAFKNQTAEEAKDPASATAPEAADHAGANAPATESSDPATLQGVNDRAAATQSRIGDAVPDETGNPPDFLQTRTNTPLQSSGSDAPSHTGSGANDTPSAQPATEQPAPSGNAKPSGVAGDEAGSAEDVEEGARAFSTGAAQGRAATNTASTIAADGKSAIADTGENALKTVGTKVAQKVGTSGALEGIGDALDFLGPIGEGLGLITSLIGVFEGLGHKKPDPDSDPQQAQKSGQYAEGSVGAGLDTKALTTQPTGALTATY